MNCPMSRIILSVFAFVMLSCNDQDLKSNSLTTDAMVVRIAELEIVPEYLEEYLAILKEESEASVRLEPGVICIFPMYQKENPTQIRLLEIYEDEAAYKSHLGTPHFKHYKTATSSMVKELRLIDMEAIDPAAAMQIFKKIDGK